MLSAVTFDFWNTLMWEPPGVLVEARIPALLEEFSRLGIGVDEERLRGSHNLAFTAYQDAWVANRQYCAPDAALTILEALDLADRVDLYDPLVRCFSTAGELAEIRPCDGAVEALQALRDAGLRLGVVCDIGLTPSPVLRAKLAAHGLLAFFDAFAFSDEVGVYKPSAVIFQHVLTQLNAEASRAAHVGDRKRTDVAGALETGMLAVRYTGVYDDPAEGPDGHAVISQLRELPPALDRLSRQAP